MNTKQRYPGPDIIRVLATLLVMTTHSIAYLGPMNTGIHSLKWTAYVIIRFAALACVPLFMLLTGYLNRNKKLTGSYFKGILPVVISYIIISALSAIYANHSGHAVFDIPGGIRAVLDFSANGYAWYVEMYIGLFLLIPFLNILFDALGTFKNRMLLCVILCCMTTLPAAFESFRVGGIALDIIPEYWEAAYPLAYYFIGAMIAEYKPKLKKRVSIPLAVLAVLIPSGLCWIFSSPENGYAWYMMNGFSCITTGAMAVTMFLVFYDVTLPRPIAAVFGELSACSFEMYLFSYIADLFLYSKTRYFMPAMVLTVFALSYVMARLLRFAVVPLYNIIKGKSKRKDTLKNG